MKDTAYLTGFISNGCERKSHKCFFQVAVPIEEHLLIFDIGTLPILSPGKLIADNRKGRFPTYAEILSQKYFLLTGKRKKAAEYAQNTIRLLDKSVYDSQLYVYRLLNSFYTQQGDYKAALTYGELALKYIKPSQYKRKDVINLYLQMSDLYSVLGDSGKAYNFLTRYNQLVAAINLLERDKAVDKLEKQFQLSEKEKEIALKENQILLQQGKVRNRNAWIAIIGSGLLIISGLLYSLYRNSKRKMHIMHQQKEIDELRAMMTGEEKERNRIAIELHDNIGGMLSAAMYSLETLKGDHKEWKDNSTLKKLDGIIGEVRNEIRKTAHTLMPDVLLRHSLPGAIQQFCHFIEHETGLQIDMQQQGSFDHLRKDVQLALYRITQELIQNILKHAEATQVFVQLHSGKDILSLTVEDDGRGFDTAKLKTAGGMGLPNMQNRLKVINGKLSIDSEAGKGTSVYIEINT